MNIINIIEQNIKTNCYKKIDYSREIDFIILHHLQANSIAETIKSLEFHEVSAHYLIDHEGLICQLVSDNDIAFHAGYSYFDKYEAINKNSIGIEFINSNPFDKKFTQLQMQSGLFLINNLINKYNIKNRYILGHSDIAYDNESGFLDRKQDPSHLFDWEFLALNNVGLYPRIYLQEIDDFLLFANGDINEKIFSIKEKLYNFGYKLTEINNEFDEEMIRLTRVFNRHYNNKIDLRDSDMWLKSSDLILNQLISMIK